MNPATLAEAVRLARASDQPNVVIAAPFPFLSAVKVVVRKARIAVQDVSAAATTIGAHTGEVSADMLRGIGVRHVLIGHSERRAAGETDATVAAKVRAALAVGLTPILCVGEPWSVRRRGFRAAKLYVKKQLTLDLKLITRYRLPITRLFVAYEPVWAISTAANRQDETPEDAAAMAQFITKQLRTFNLKLTTNVLYGGSVNSANAAAFLARREFSGVLVGGASLKPAEFRKITAVAKKA